MASHSLLRNAMATVCVVVGVVVGLSTPTTVAVAGASCDGGSSTSVSGSIQAGTLVIGAEQEVDEATCGGGTNTVGTSPPRDSDLDALCVQQAISHGQEPFTYCDLEVDQIDPSELTPGIVARAFRRLPLPGSELVVQPPGGRTLVNFETNFYTERGAFTRTVSLLGRRVELRIWPASFGWRFGDGASRETSSPGSAYPDLEVTHRYLRSGRVAARVDTTYAAEFRVNGGSWRQVAGTVTIPGEPVGLRVVTARPVLVGY